MPGTPTISTGLLGLLNAPTQSEREPAWKMFVGIYQSIIVEILRKSGFSLSDAEDVTQEVFLSLRKDLAGFKRTGRPGGFRKFLYQRINWTARDYLRKSNSIPRALGGTDGVDRFNAVEDPYAESNQDELTEGPVCVSDFRDAILGRASDLVQTRVNETTWQSFWLCTVEGKRMDLVAEEIGIKEASVKKNRTRVLAMIKATIKEISDPPA